MRDWALKNRKLSVIAAKMWNASSIGTKTRSGNKIPFNSHHDAWASSSRPKASFVHNFSFPFMRPKSVCSNTKSVSMHQFTGLFVVCLWVVGDRPKVAANLNFDWRPSLFLFLCSSRAWIHRSRSRPRSRVHQQTSTSYSQFSDLHKLSRKWERERESLINFSLVSCDFLGFSFRVYTNLEDV